MQVKDVLINSPRDAVPLLNGYSCKKQEYFGIICLNGGRKTISRDLLFIGGASHCDIDEKVLFWKVARRQPSGVILFHNHPSGNPSPSDDDVCTTKQIFKALELLGIQLLDHVIITRYEYFSFLEHNMLPIADTQNCVKSWRLV